MHAPTKGDVSAKILDVSLGGLRIESDKFIEQGTEISVSFDGSSHIDATGIIRRVQLKNGVFEFGIEFIRTTELQKSLEEYLERFEATLGVN